MTRPVARRIVSINVPYSLLKRVNAYVRDLLPGDSTGKIGRSAFFTRAAREYLDRRLSIGTADKGGHHT